MLFNYISDGSENSIIECNLIVDIASKHGSLILY